MKDKRYDLHCHTTCSDGSMTPQELIEHAKEIGLSGLAITDHDTIEAYREAIPLSQQLGLELISGAEFSTHYKETSVHLLAYAFSLNNPEIIRFCKRHQERRRKRNLAIIEKLKKAKMSISEEELIINERVAPISVGRPHIAEALVKRGYVSSIQEAFNRYIGEGCPYFEPGERFSVEETIEVIHKAKGKAVIAHPHLINESRVVEALTQFDFDGIEVYYARFGESQCQKWLQLAKKKNWLVTGGSDFHGIAKQNILLGSSWAPEETFDILREHFLKNNDL